MVSSCRPIRSGVCVSMFATTFGSRWSHRSCGAYEALAVTLCTFQVATESGVEGPVAAVIPASDQVPEGVSRYLSCSEKRVPAAGFGLRRLDCATLTKTTLPVPAPSTPRSDGGTVSTAERTAAGIQPVLKRWASVMLFAPATTFTLRA